jgi:catechol 2,3-dioxygenase-like lactoylglutathione lyase family enzyme
MITAIDHVQLAIPRGGEDRARKFWIELFGFHEIEKPADMKKRGGAWFALGDVQIHVGVEEPFVAAKKAHPALRARNGDDVRALATKLGAAGIEVRWAHDAPGVVRFHVDDPFGNRIEVTAPP